MELDPDIIFWLEPLTQRAMVIFGHDRNKDHFEPGYSSLSLPTREVTPATDAGESVEEEEGTRHGEGAANHRLVYRFCTTRKDPKRGIVFGSSRKCDGFLGHPEEGISARHFRIDIDEQKRLYLESDSTVEMSVSYDGEAEHEFRRKHRWLLLPDCQLRATMKGIKMKKGVELPNLVFSIRVPSYVSRSKHDTLVESYLEEVRKANGHCNTGADTVDLHLLGIDPMTAAGSVIPSPKRGRIYVRTVQLGIGASGRTYRGKDVSSGQTCAIKELQGDVSHWKGKIGSLKSLSHTNVLRVIDFTVREGMPCMITEYAEGGSVEQRRWELHYADIISMVHQAAGGLEYLHAQGVTHRDIKGENVLIQSRSPTEPLHFLLCDFDLADYPSCGNKLYLPPELCEQSWHLAGEDYPTHAPMFCGNEGNQRSIWTPAGDMWQLGVLVYDLLYGLPVQELLDGSYLSRQALYGELICRATNLDPKLLINSLSFGMLILNPMERLTAAACSLLSQSSPQPSLQMSSTTINEGLSSPVLMGPLCEASLSPSRLELASGADQRNTSGILYETSDSREPTEIVSERSVELHVLSEHQQTGPREMTEVELREDVPGYMSMAIQGVAVQLRISDCCLNATDVLRAAGKSNEQIEQFQRALPNAKDQFTPTGGYWVSLDVGQHLCDRLDLSQSLMPLIEYGQKRKALHKLAESDEIFSLQEGDYKVSIHSQDLWINITHICSAAKEQDARSFTTRLQKANMRSVKKGPLEHRGTYTIPSFALQLCVRLDLKELGLLLRAELRRRGNKAVTVPSTTKGSLAMYETVTVASRVVCIRLQDLWVNVTPIMRAAGKTEIRRWVGLHVKSNAITAVKDCARAFQGTYANPTVALLVCNKLGLHELEQDLRTTLNTYGFTEDYEIHVNAQREVVHEALPQIDE